MLLRIVTLWSFANLTLLQLDGIDIQMKLAPFLLYGPKLMCLYKRAWLRHLKIITIIDHQLTMLIKSRARIFSLLKIRLSWCLHHLFLFFVLKWLWLYWIHRWRRPSRLRRRSVQRSRHVHLDRLVRSITCTSMIVVKIKHALSNCLLFLVIFQLHAAIMF
jgi:hypothetical protein